MPNNNNMKNDSQNLNKRTDRNAGTTTGKIKDMVHDGTHALGDNIEKVGRKLQEKGYERAGTAIEKAGDKIEHLAD